MTTVVVKNGDTDKAIRQFKSLVARSGVPSELKKHREYAKPGVVRRERKKEAIKNSHKKNRRRNYDN